MQLMGGGGLHDLNLSKEAEVQQRELGLRVELVAGGIVGNEGMTDDGVSTHFYVEFTGSL